MVAPADEAVDELGGGAAPADCGTMSLVTMNVDGLGDYQTSPAERMDAILSEVMQANPEVIMLQEVV